MSERAIGGAIGGANIERERVCVSERVCGRVKESKRERASKRERESAWVCACVSMWQ